MRRLDAGLLAIGLTVANARYMPSSSRWLTKRRQAAALQKGRLNFMNSCYLITEKNIRILLFIFCFLLLNVFKASAESDSDKWIKKTTKKLTDGGNIIHTALGDIQVVVKGCGPAVLVIHGGFGGWDQGELIASNIEQKGFQVIIPSRPGYLSTPIYTDPLLLQKTPPSTQADLLAAMLDCLGVEKAAVVGFSLGAPVAYEFGFRHPTRTNAVVLESIGASPIEDGLFYLMLGISLTVETKNVDYATYLLHLSLKKNCCSSIDILQNDTNLKGCALNLRKECMLCHLCQYLFLKKMLKTTIPLSPRLLGALNDCLGVDYWTKSFTPSDDYCLPTLIIQAINDSNGCYSTAALLHCLLPTSQLVSVLESGHFIWIGPSTCVWEKQLNAFLKQHAQ